MYKFNCIICDYHTNRKSDLNKHLNTKKHKKNIKICIPIENENEKTTYQEYNVLKNKDNFEIEGSFKCHFCNAIFTRQDNLSRHIKSYCKNKINCYKEEYNKNNDEYIKLLKNKDEQINKLLDKIENNTYIQNTQNNVVINDFGNENNKMLTKNFLFKLINVPMSSIPRMVKKIHFNDDFPENKNMRILNKKDNKLQIIKNGKWQYVSKKETLRNLIDQKNCTLEEFYQTNKEMLNQINRKRFEKFREKLDDDEIEVWKNLESQLELLFWNSM